MSQVLRLLEACFDTCHSEPVNRFIVCDLVTSLNNFFKSHIFVDVRRRLAREDNMMSTTYWSDFVHVAGRLLTYKRAVDLMDLVAKIWPQLFSDIQICMIPSSSTVSDDSFKSQSGVLRIKPWTAAQIMSKMSSDESLLGRFAAKLGSLSVHDIDAKVSELWRSAPKPTVHAEVLVHDWLENTEGGIRPERFFNRWKFIGSSKPPCKLCSYFFDEYPTDVQVRPSHQNAYFAWRMPDMYGYQGEESSRKRMLVMDSIKTRIRADVVRMLSEKLADGRSNDSSAYTSLCRGIAPGPPNNPISLEATAQLLESCTLSTTHEQGATDRESAKEVVRVLDENHEEELLFKGRSAVRKTVQNRLGEQ
ncbi:uncharacterized protein BKA55DRAFT_263591 [Fusarium redolens]|uniref:Uncharacterized protein n=1 Tax=Fusarium redolens TaxID=48865 RepID=A0A9P9FWW8_FUSRE|nr:uncharacterized protein BKA55DRAFT_263591 [Fusarium redolens]KAH7207852.1 hypothetical protein BKA55DRAFT_263591 [Fusarium redolens]